MRRRSRHDSIADQTSLKFLFLHLCIVFGRIIRMLLFEFICETRPLNYVGFSGMKKRSLWHKKVKSY